jgi:predicted lipoprotein with Yx(FWY)xxD motif
MATLSTYLKTTLAGAALVTLAACGGSNGSSAAGSGAGAASGGSTTSSGSDGKVEVETHSGPLGTYLTDSAGRTLYMFASDTSTTSTCTGSCLTYWPPLMTSSTPEASGSAAAAMLGAISSGGSSKQVTYAGHPLYYYTGDVNPGDTNGQGSTNYGADWWVLAPSGKPITATGGSTTGSAGGSGGGAYG